MKTKTINTYSYSELTGRAKDKAREWLSLGGPDYWENANEDANSIGLKITESNVDRNRHAKGHFIHSPEECAQKITEEHGDTCETFKTASAYLLAVKALGDRPENGYTCPAGDYDYAKSEAWESARTSLDDDFLKDVLEDYSMLIQRDYEYSYSEECCSENAEANDYQFDENGRIV